MSARRGFTQSANVSQVGSDVMSAHECAVMCGDVPRSLLALFLELVIDWQGDWSTSRVLPSRWVEAASGS
jgi:hypothetical protein